MIKDALDHNADKIIDNFYFDKAKPNGNKDTKLGEGGGYNPAAQRVVKALAIVNDRMVQAFPDEVKTSYIAIRVNDHIETMSIKSQVMSISNKDQSLERLRHQKGLRILILMKKKSMKIFNMSNIIL